MKLVLVRHLPTAWNLEGRLQGRRDIALAPLDAEALAGVEKLRAALAGHGPFERVFCSTLARTRQTAEWCGFSDVEAEPLLDELDFGIYEGVRRAEFLAAVGEAWRAAPETLSFGEKVSGLETRVRCFFERHRESGDVLAFSHGAWMRAARAIAETGSMTAMNRRDLANSAVVVLRLD